MSAGSIRERAPGVWQVRVYAGTDPLTGRKKWASRTVHGGKRAAEKVRAEMVAGGVHRPATGTVQQALDAWLAKEEAASRSVNTMTGYRNHHRILSRELGRLRLAQLTTALLDQWITGHLRAGKSPTTVHHWAIQLQAALHLAVRYGWLPANPMALVDIPKVRARDLDRLPTGDEIMAALASLPESRWDTMVAFALLAHTGMRRGEVCGLRWDDWAPATSRLTIRRSIAHGSGAGLVVQSTKSKRPRTITLDPDAARLLELHRVRQAETFGTTSKRLAGFVLADPMGDGSAPWRPDRLTLAWRRLARDQGFPTVRLHDLRHWHVSSLIADGVPVSEVSARAGHARPSVTLAIYTHDLTQGDQSASAAAMERRFGG